MYYCDNFKTHQWHDFITCPYNLPLINYYLNLEK